MQLVTEIIHHLPPLRRYARAATGDQAIGDDCVALMLERLSQRGDVTSTSDIKIALYRELTSCLLSYAGAEAHPNSAAARNVLKLSMQARQAVLLTTLEGLTETEAAQALGLTPHELAAELSEARRTLGSLISTDVLIIEDEFFISRDLAKIVTSLGHRVVATARTHAQARVAAAKFRPGLILADVHLADDSSGIEAVNEIIEGLNAPVIFITAYPEKLLTGLRPEPTYIIAKPYRVQEIKAVVSQSLFFEERARFKSPSDQSEISPATRQTFDADPNFRKLHVI